MALALLAHWALLAGAGLHQRHAAAGAAAPGQAVQAVLTVALLPDAASQSSIALPVPPLASSRRDQAAVPQEPEPAVHPPVIAEGLASGSLLLLPGVATGNPVVHFQVDADGAVESVALQDHDYSDAEASLVLAALRLVRFHPARRQGVAVPGELVMVVMVASEIGM